jgi:putative endopeptidase
MKYLFILCFAVFYLSGCSHPAVENKPDILLDDIDSTVKPSEDFFLFANGGWIKKSPIPESESSWSIGNLVQDDIYARLKIINEEADSAKGAEGTVAQKIGDFWFSGMDTVDIEKNGLKPLAQTVDLIEGIKSKDDLAAVGGLFHTLGINVFFDDNVSQDAKSSDVMAYYLNQGGLGMPDRDYYFNSDAKTVAVRKAYTRYLFTIFKQLGVDSAAAETKSNAVVSLETRLAGMSRKLADLRDPYANYHKMSIPALNRLTPNINWNLFLKKVGISNLDSVIVGQPEFFIALNKEFKAVPPEEWKEYMRVQLFMHSAPYLDSVSSKNLFAYRKSLSGAAKQRERWKRVLDAEENAIGEALGQLFVHEFFNEKAKKRYADLIENVRSAYKERIRHLTWMSDSTKQKAIYKLSLMTPKVGYPDKWKDFSALKIDRGPYVLNVQRSNQWWYAYYISKLGKPVDRTEWDMTPQTYNAYYNASNNEIVMPAAAFIIPGMQDDDLDDTRI